MKTPTASFNVFLTSNASFISLQEKAVRAECRRVEAYMKKQTQQQLEDANNTFQEQLKEALHDARIEFEVEKMLAVREAREEEINNAVEEAARTADIEEKKRTKIILEAEKAKAVCSTS